MYRRVKCVYTDYFHDLTKNVHDTIETHTHTLSYTPTTLIIHSCIFTPHTNNRWFMTLYGIITRSLSANYSWARFSVISTSLSSVQEEIIIYQFDRSRKLLASFYSDKDNSLKDWRWSKQILHLMLLNRVVFFGNKVHQVFVMHVCLYNLPENSEILINREEPWFL